jgi:hypothetical protein
MRDDTAQFISVTTQAIREMSDRGLFRLDSIVIPVSSEDAEVSIVLHLNDDRTLRRGRYGFPISGFPRRLADGESPKGTSK